MGRLKRAVRSFALLVLLLSAGAAGLFAPLDRALVQERFRLTDRAASGDIVFVAIDKSSIDEVGVWPWPRRTHAQMIDAVLALGASAVVLDLDFSNTSNAVDDAALAAALERAQGRVTLPVFLQNPDAADRTTVTVTRPAREFADNAWLGTVNVSIEDDGRVWSFPAGGNVDEEWMASIPAQIGGNGEAANDPIHIDYGIDPSTVPVISAHDLLSGSARKELISGKTVVIGAFATELRDVYSVPTHGIIPGVLLQIMAAETLLADRQLDIVSGSWPLLAVFTLILLMHVVARIRIRAFLTLGALLAIIVEAVAYGVYSNWAIMVHTSAALVLIACASLLHMLAHTDILNRLIGRARIETRNTRSVLETVFRKSFDSILVLDEEARVLEASESADELFGTDVKSIGNEAFVRILPHKLLTDAKSALAEFKKGVVGRSAPERVYFIDAKGNERTIEYVISPSVLVDAKGYDGENYINTLALRDVTDSEIQQKRINFMSRHDELTDALRRPAFVEALGEQMGRVGADGSRLCVVATSIPRFNAINMALGRDNGEWLLRMFHDRMAAIDPEPVATCRLGGENFACALWLPGDVGDLPFAVSLLTQLVAPFRLGNSQAHAKVHLGIARCEPGNNNEALTASQLLGHAETALDCAREHNGSCAIEYSSEVDARITRNKTIESGLWDSLIDEDFRLFYQPQVDLVSGEVIGFEALIRWQHPTLGFLTPSDFVAVAQTNGFITQLGMWVLRKACHDAMAWPDDVVLSVNVSPEQFESNDLVANVSGALRSSGLPPHRLLVEVLETSAIEDTEMVLNKINELRAMGVLIALDDFGTGNASLDYLTRFPFDKIKVDRSFTRDVGLSQTKQAIIRSIKVLAEAFETKMLCEGIETEEDRSLVALLGCDEAQGYLFGRPMELNRTLQFFEERSDSIPVAG